MKKEQAFPLARFFLTNVLQLPCPFGQAGTKKIFSLAVVAIENIFAGAQQKT
ncbi:MAG TPA: hypothetical protein VGP43_05830 [Chitinophagaceae bacterium]|nr:hypothetical protein [Chitinophagaceae bacterium]